MWVIRYLIPGIILVAFGIFLGSNLNQKTSIQFLTWGLNEVPLILIVAIAFIVGLFARYYVIFLRWMNKKQMARMKKKILTAHEKESGKISKPETEKDYSRSMGERTEGEMEGRIDKNEGTGINSENE